MKLTILDGKMMTDRAAAHDYLARSLDLPEYYGRNLDALYDCLSEMGGSDFILVKNTKELLDQLGGYGDQLLHVLRDAGDREPVRVIFIH